MVGLIGEMQLHVKAFAATALVFDVRVGEFKPFVQAFFNEIQLSAVEELQALAVDTTFTPLSSNTVSSAAGSSTNSST
jgi:hypothetical protein